jgi:hypothetical protein
MRPAGLKPDYPLSRTSPRGDTDERQQQPVQAANQVSKKPPSAKPGGPVAEWKRKDEQLDDALRQTFPASDALSIVQNVRGS